MRELGLALTPEQVDSFQFLHVKLYETNEKMNLTRVAPEQCAERHFLDSILMQDLFPADAEVLDIGTGPGFPAVPLAIVRPDLVITALDSNAKMLSFLHSVAPPNVLPINYRAEEWGVREAFRIVTGRAVAPLPIQLELSAAPCEIGGLVIPMRTMNDAILAPRIRVKDLGLKYERSEVRRIPGSDVERLFPIYRKVDAGKPRFPRRWAEIKAKPIG
ncbi:MAG: 16S rRNA (guanine(527)-N(7))-methyltransferase RsmG [Fimbriimonadaceae bacterium]|nr:16S rRNA (guanine(527)-N(7))-methyltransferase RsmG [Fimbriimonadaceae bacterium]